MTKISLPFLLRRVKLITIEIEKYWGNNKMGNGVHFKETNETIDHPLMPLTANEISEASRLVREEIGESRDKIRFESIELLEPKKTTVRSYRAGQSITRLAKVVVYKLGKMGVWIFKVSLSDSLIEEKHEIPTAQPMIQLEEFLDIENAVKSNNEFILACKRRGITDMSLVCVDAWSAGSFGHEEEKGRHISHTFAWLRNSETDHQYAHPIEGLNAIVDIKTLEVIRVNDNRNIPIPSSPGNYSSEFEKTPRKHLQPIIIKQPKGVSFKFVNGKLEWDKWSLVIGFNSREGLTLHDIACDERSVCYRASISEMVVPYGSPDPTHARKNVFDIGEYGIGKLANSLELGCDCLGAIQYLDCWVSDINGTPMQIKNGICIHEEDYGILWKHFDFRLNSTEVRRARRLVISSISTVGNYEYASYWYLYLDGEIEFEIKATGIINTVGCIPYQGNKYGTEVSPGVIGQIHQHIFCARLEMAIDGDKNSVFQCDTIAEPTGKNNPYGNAFYVRDKRIEREGGLNRDFDKQRYWKFVSEKNKNYMGGKTAYKLEPKGSIGTFHDPYGPSGSRMGFIFKPLWVTPFDPQERFPAGDFVNGSKSGEGLPAFIKKKRSVKDTEVVAWHVFGLHHLPRLEDYPVTPCVRTGFKLTPLGFFDKNPGIDLAPETESGSCFVKQKEH